MLEAPVPANERLRLAALRALDILDTPREERFDRLTRLASSVIEAPIAAVSLVDEARQWFKSSVGLPVRETTRDISFCGHAILGDGPFVVPNALSDTRFADNPLVQGQPHIRAYAGQPIRSADGLCVGTFCVIYDSSREFSENQLETLADLAALVERELHLDELINLQKKAHAAEARNRQLEDEVARFFSLSLDMLCIAGKNGYFQRINPAWSSTLGWTDEELLGRPYIEFVHPDDRAATAAEADRLATGGQTVSFENRYLCKDGSYRLLRWNAVAVRDDDTIHLIAQDITDQKRVERMKNEFVSTVSHELRTPLTSIRGSLDLIGSGVTGEIPEESKRLLEIARNNCSRLVLLINDILDMEKIEAGRIELRAEAHDVVQLVERALRENEGYASQHGVSFALVSAAAGSWAMVDPDRLIQVLTNLLSNAAKFAPQGSEVEVSVTREGSSVRVSVRDHGDGIPVKFRQQIFEKFAQADSSDARKRGGTGLGLSISKAIVERFGGTIDFETELGAGSTFYFDLPVIAAALEPVSEDPVREDPRVLVCEDDLDVSAKLREILEDSGYACHVVHSAAEASESLTSRRYDAMILDLVLPGEDGVSFIRRLRADRATRSMPIIVTSMRAGEGRDEMCGSAAGVVDWIDKPIDEQRLLAGIHAATIKSESGRRRILHVEDDPDVRVLVEKLLADVAEVTSVGTMAEARAALSRESFDLALLDCRLPDGRGTELLPLLNDAECGPIPAVIFSAYEMTATEAKDAAAVLMKSQVSGDALRDTIRSLIETTEPVPVP